jgi:hypothetical protein
MKKCILTLCLLLAAVLFTGCASGDPISQRNADEALDTISRDLDPSLPKSYREVAIAQAKAWANYERAKLGMAPIE